MNTRTIAIIALIIAVIVPRDPAHLADAGVEAVVGSRRLRTVRALESPDAPLSCVLRDPHRCGGRRAAADAAPAVTGTLALAASGASVGYDFTAAPLLDGPAAAEAVGLAEPIRRSATLYAPMRLSRAAGPACGGQVLQIADARALLQVEAVELNVLAGRGTAEAELARVGDGPYGGGVYPAAGLVREPASGCLLRAVGSSGDACCSARRRRSRSPGTGFGCGSPTAPGGARGRVTEAASEFGPATEATVTVALEGTPAELGASCKVPSALTWPGTPVKRKRGARRLLERAGFSRVRFGGVRRGLARGMHGRYVVLASSGSLPCERTVRFHFGAA